MAAKNWIASRATGEGAKNGTPRIYEESSFVAEFRTLADAKLAAAAPEMFAALQLLRVYKEAVAYALTSRPETEAGWLVAMELADRAMRKAKEER